jgi:enamine deaminase RidA (YjgF/YER057c/UK114 family)
VAALEHSVEIQHTLSQRLPPPVAPHPHAARAGDFVYVSSVFPVDPETGQAVQAPAGLAYAKRSTTEAQVEDVVRQLQAILAEAGSSLENVLRAEIHLARPQDFVEVKEVWKTAFPRNPPALTVVEVGDEHIYPGVALNVHCLALANDSALQRQPLRTPEAPDPMEAIWAPQAVRAGPFVFPTTSPATDYQTGIPVGRRPGFPNYGSDAEMQAEYVFDNLNRVLATAGTSLEQAVESQLYEPDLLTFHDVDGVWGRYMPVPPPRSSMGIKGLLVPGALMAANLVVLAPDGQYRKEESRAGIRWHPVEVRKVNFSPTMKVGPWRFLAGQVASPDFQSYTGAPPGLPSFFSDIEVQTHFTMGLLREQLEANESDFEHVVDARIYLTRPRRDFRGFARAWRTYYPDQAQAPAMSIIPSTGIMFAGPVVEIDLTAVAR